MKTHTNTFDRFKIYQLRGRGIGWNPTLQEWELYEMDSDGGIQDLLDRTPSRKIAKDWLHSAPLDGTSR